jgi:EAL domain-containing protein (putative c-di-GMP-specific phosphodiesterase class I)
MFLPLSALASIVAEGAETAEQLQILQSLSCAEVQGYYISGPVPEEDVPAILTEKFLFPLAAIPDSRPPSSLLH